MKHGFPGWLLLGLAIASGCHHAPAPRIDGTSSFTFVEPPPPPSAPPKPQGEAGDGPRPPVEMMLLAVPIQPLAKPVYPTVALGREDRPVLVGVRITIDATGRVASVRTSLAALSTPTSLADEFRGAVEEALTQWRFRPAELRRLAPINDTNGTGAWTLLSREPTDCIFDVSFVFQATGEVVSRTLKQ
jgi:hypothetical protein